MEGWKFIKIDSKFTLSGTYRSQMEMEDTEHWSGISEWDRGTFFFGSIKNRQGLIDS